MAGRLGRVVVPIRQRPHRKIPHHHSEADPLLRSMTHGIMTICLGGFLIFIGLLLTILGGTHARTDGHTDESQAMLITGPLCLAVGCLVGLIGSVLYYRAYKRKCRQMDSSTSTLNSGGPIPNSPSGGAVPYDYPSPEYAISPGPERI